MWILQFIGGAVLGVIYFGGLWLTVRNLGTIRNPALVVMSSFLLRTSLIVLALYLITSARWEYLAVAVAGFIVSRFMLTRYLTIPARRPREE